MAVIDKTVGTASRDESTLIAAEASLPADLVSDDEIWRFSCYKDSVFTDAGFIVTGSTTDTTHYIEFTVPIDDRHSGTRGTGTVFKPGASVHGLKFQTVNARLFYFEMDGSSLGTNFSCIVTQTVPDTGNVYIGNNLVYDNKPTGANNGGILLNNGGVGTNNFVWIFGNTILNVGGSGIDCGTRMTVEIYNNAVYKANASDTTSRSGIRVSTAAAAINTVINNIAFDCGSTNQEDFSAGRDTTSNNISSDSTGEITSKVATDNFVNTDAGTEDVHLLTGADAKYAGIAIATLGITPDILTDADGETRGPEGNNFSSGAYEFPCTGGGATTALNNNKTDSFKGGSFKRVRPKKGAFR